MNRKELKRAGKKSFHKHYLVLMFLCVLLAIFGVEAGYSTRVFDLRTKDEEGEATQTVLNSNTVYSAIMEGDLTLGEEISQGIRDNMPAEIGGMAAFGTTSGVLAGVVNNILSGSIYITIANALYGATQSETAMKVLFMLINVLLIFAVWFFIRNVLSVMVRRMFLESRSYEKLPFLDCLHIFAVRKWLRVCLTLFLKALFYFLWCFTIVGIVVKRYSYYQVPFIVAENPGIKSLDAITLSRKMMDGHKWEAFVFDLSFIGWYLLAIFTAGLSDAFYGFPYRTAARTEYYVYLRGLARQNGIPGVEALNDVYLYEKADRITLYENYFDVVDMQTLVLEKEIKLSGIRAFILKWFSIWAGRYEDKKVYDEVEGYKYAIARSIQSRDGLSYPLRLSPLWKERKKLFKPISFLRAYSIWTLILMFILFCFIGWCWEVSLYLVRDGFFANRGVMHGPWLPIYGSGGIVVLLICSRFRKHPVVELIVSVVLCGFIEYIGAYMLENKYHERWWSYDGCFLNIHGRVCAEGLIVFGIACMLVVYAIAPIFDYIVCKIPKRILQTVALGLLIVFLIDAFYSRIHPNMAKGAIEAKEDARLDEIPGEESKIPLPMTRQA